MFKRYTGCVTAETPTRGAMIISKTARKGYFVVWYTIMYMPQKRVEKRKYKDRAEYLKKAVADRRRKLREMSIDYGGGECQVCGYKKCKRALSFHHKDPKEKDFGLSARGLTRSWDKIQKELDKCILVCANCHMEIHEGITNID